MGCFGSFSIWAWRNWFSSIEAFSLFSHSKLVLESSAFLSLSSVSNFWTMESVWLVYESTAEFIYPSNSLIFDSYSFFNTILCLLDSANSVFNPYTSFNDSLDSYNTPARRSSSDDLWARRSLSSISCCLSTSLRLSSFCSSCSSSESLSSMRLTLNWKSSWFLSNLLWYSSMHAFFWEIYCSSCLTRRRLIY